MDGESRKHRAMDMLLAMLKLGIVGKARRRFVLELLTCASGIGTDLNALVWKSAPAASLGVEPTGLGVLTVPSPSGRLGGDSKLLG